MLNSATDAFYSCLNTAEIVFNCGSSSQIGHKLSNLYGEYFRDEIILKAGNCTSTLFNDLQINKLTECCASLKDILSGYKMSVAVEENGHFACQYLGELVQENGLPAITDIPTNFPPIANNPNLLAIADFPANLPTVDYTPIIKMVAITALAVFVGYKLYYRQAQHQVNN